MPTTTPITDTVGKTVAAVAIDDTDLIIKFNDGTFSIVSLDWDQGTSEPVLYEPSFAMYRHAIKAVNAGVITEQQHADLLDAERIRRENEIYQHELATYQRLKEKFEPGT